MLRDVEGIALCRLTDSDVVRHVIVQRIIKAYEEDENRRKAKRCRRKVQEDSGTALLRKSKLRRILRSLSISND